MIRALVRLWRQIELRHIDDAIADEVDRERNHARTMRNLYAIRAGLLWQINGKPVTHSAVGVWPRERKANWRM